MAFTPLVSSRTVTGETVSSGTQSIVIGGIASNTTINDSGYQNISSGGVTNSVTINSGGWQQVSSGGVASSTTISSGGSQWIFGGTANSTTINSGGDMRFFGSGMATNTTINSGGVMALGIGASATNIYQQSGGAVYFTTGATVINGINTRTDGHSAFSIVDGVASNFLLASGGCLAVQSGRSAANTIIGNGAAMNIGSADYYYLNMTNAGALTLNLTGLSSDANLALYDAKGKLLKASNNKSNANENITSMALSGGAYYVKIAPADGGKGTVNNTGYTLSNTVDYFPADTAGNTFAAALKVTASGRISEWVGFGDKDDYYKFELQTATTVTLNLTDMASNVNLYLYDSKSKQLAASAKTGNADESISKTLAAGLYYVKATLAGTDNTYYNLNFNIDPAAFKSGSLRLFGPPGAPINNGSDAALTGGNDPLKKNQGVLAS